MDEFILGTRGSLLARAQSQLVADEITSVTGIPVRLKIISTRGDRIQNKPLAEIGGKGLFTFELEQELRAGDIDFAVHSLKDLPTEDPQGLFIASIPKREDPRDVVIGKLEGRIGTGSLRRRTQLLEAVNGLTMHECRGNVDTRIRKLDSGQYDGIILAQAGLNRLKIVRKDMNPLPIDICIPACGQGALGIQCSIGNHRVIEALNQINHQETELCVNEERIFLHSIGGGCHVAAAAHVWIESGKMYGMAMMHDANTNRIKSGKLTGENLGQRLFQVIKG